MLIGAMNHPAADIHHEIKWMSEMGLDFIDLTLEPPSAAVWKVKPHEIRTSLDDHNLRVIGHTAYYLPIASPFESLRRAAVDELKKCLEIFAVVGAKWMNIHPDGHTPMHDHSFMIERNLQSLRDLSLLSDQMSVGLMLENLPGKFNNPSQLGELLQPLPSVGLHLDIGHSNLMVEENTADSLIAAFGSRLRHVHLHDNKGGQADLHLPLGAGNVNVRRHLGTLRKSGYDATITLEVFSADRRHLAYSRDVLREMWNEAPEPTRKTAVVPPESFLPA